MEIFFKNLSDFDREGIPHERAVVEKMIQIVQPELSPKLRTIYADGICLASKKYNINSQIMIALIDSESDFNAQMISDTGDLSIAQINLEVWNKEFKWMGLSLIQIQELKKPDQHYALLKMGLILSIIKKRHEKKDRRWYARYHSNTMRHKKDYLKKIEVRMNLLKKSQHILLASLGRPKH